ncbi:MAG: HlyD family efflux transporter periplasmic adaptor subunit [Spirochaetia bacterium]|jgi:multidrug resistance efflux pump
MKRLSRLVCTGIGLSALALILAATGCAPKQKSADPSGGAARTARGPGVAEIAVQAVPVVVAPLVVERQTSGTVKPVMQSQVVGQVGGVVASVLRKAGDRVDKGDVVIQLDDAQYRLSVKTAQASLDAANINLATGQDTTAQASPKLDLQVRAAESAVSVAQRNYDARKALFDLGGATGSDLDSAKSDLDMAQANLEAARTALDQNQKAPTQNIAQLKLAVEQADFALQQAQLNLQHASIKAPYAGRLVTVNVMTGEFVSPNAPAFVIASQDREVDFNVPPADAASLPVGAPVTFTLNGTRHSLRVSQAPEVPVNGVVPLVAAVPGSLPIPFGAIGTLSYSMTLARGAQVPTGALQTNENQNFVYVVEGGKAFGRNITVLAESGSTAAVTGVSAGSLVVVNPPPGLLDGSTVKTLPLAEGTK